MNIINVLKSGGGGGLDSKKNALCPPSVPPPDGLTELLVWSVPPNPHLLICHLPEKDGSNPMNLVCVQVRDNRLFLKKMRLRARPAGAQFILEGPCPRWRGRW